MVENDLLSLLVNLLLLPQDNVPLPLNSSRLELGVLENVADDVHGGRDVLPEALGVVHGLLARGVGVEVSANVLDFELEGVLCSLRGTLEGHVFQEMGGAVVSVRLSARARVNPDTNSSRLRMRVRLGCYCEAVGKGGNLSPWAVDGCRKRPGASVLHVVVMSLLANFGR